MAKISGKPLDKTFESWVSIAFSGTRVPFTISSSNEKIQSWYRQKQGFSFFFPILWCWNFANSQNCGGYIPHDKNSQKFPNILSKKWRSNFVGEKTLVGRDKVKSKSKENLHSSCNQLVGFQLSFVPVQAKHLPIRHRKGLLLPEKIPSKHTTGDTLGCRTCRKSHWKKYPWRICSKKNLSTTLWRLTVSTVPAREKTITTRIMITHNNHAMKSKHGELRSIWSVSFTFLHQSVMIPVILKMSPVHRLRLNSTHLLLKNSCSAWSGKNCRNRYATSNTQPPPWLRSVAALQFGNPVLDFVYFVYLDWLKSTKEQLQKNR